MGSGSSPSSSGNLGGSGRRANLSQVAVHYSEINHEPLDTSYTDQ